MGVAFTFQDRMQWKPGKIVDDMTKSHKIPAHQSVNNIIINIEDLDIVLFLDVSKIAEIKIEVTIEKLDSVLYNIKDCVLDAYGIDPLINEKRHIVLKYAFSVESYDIIDRTWHITIPKGYFIDLEMQST